MRKGVLSLLLALMFICTAASACAEQADPALERLNQFAEHVVELKTYDFGYPCNQNVELSGFYEWLVQSGFDNAMVNNAGDPFNNNELYMNALDFEREVIEFFGPLYGFDPADLWGIVTFSGTDGNDHGIYFGSKYLEKKTGEKPIVYISDAAHYSNMRLADLQNLDMVLVASDEHGCMIPEELEKSLNPDRPALMVYAMGTTFKGGVDDQKALNDVLAKYPDMEVYRHVDAALFGGYLPYTEYRDAVDRRVQPFDSIAVSGHKFFGMDEPAGIFLTTMEIKNNQNPFNVTYLNGSMPMINCSRSALSPLKLWWIIQHEGIEGFTEQAEGMLERAAWLKNELDKLGWRAWLEPMSNTVYFKRPPEEIAEKYILAPDYDERLGGDLSHIVVMQHVTKERLQVFLDDLAAVSPPKVILDTDMEYLDDDAIAMFMLSQAERYGEVDVLGVTSVGGNVYTAEATAAVLRQLELIGRSDIPVYQGTDVPLAGFRDMEKEARLYGAPDWCGAYWDFDTNWYSDPYARPMDYMDLPDEPMFGYPTTRAMEQTAWDFMIDQVHRYPGEVTIMSIGAATNIATAIKKDPTFVQDAAGIIYMGGDIDRAGDATAAAELNWFYDPDAIRICLEADWKSQLVVPDDLAREVLMEETVFDRLRENGDNEITALILSTEDDFDPKITHFVWDVVVPAVFLKPEIMSNVETRYLTADDQPGLNYGRAVSWVQNRHNNPETGEGMPEGVEPVQILFSIDSDKFWDFYVDILTRD